jgi:hypothetical protein
LHRTNIGKKVTKKTRLVIPVEIFIVCGHSSPPTHAQMPFAQKAAIAPDVQKQFQASC